MHLRSRGLGGLGVAAALGQQGQLLVRGLFFFQRFQQQRHSVLVSELLGQRGDGAVGSDFVMLDFLRAVKSGEPEVTAPIYSHVIYDVLPDRHEIVHQPDILILEGLNVLQVDSHATEFVSDYFDFSIYLDADESLIESWFIERFHALRRTVFQDPQCFYKHFAYLTDEQATTLAGQIWESINGRNLRENIDPTKTRASLVMNKGSDHRITEVQLRKL